VSAKKAYCPVAGKIELRVPDGWSVTPVEPMFHQTRFELQASEVSDRNEITVVVTLEDGTERSASFVILGPGEAKGFPAGQNVPRCPTCGARQEACICGPAGP